MSETARTEESTLTNICGDPPKINISLPERNELTQNFKLWKDVELPIDILLLTVKDCEFLSCYYYIVDPFRSYCKGLGHVYFGSIGKDQDVKLKVALMRCSEGSKAPGGSLTVVKNAVTQLRPKAVFSVGHCSGMNQETTKLGDVVLSEKLTTYSHQKATKVGKKFCGVTTPVSRDIAELIKCAGYGWNAPLENPKERKVEVHCGEVLSGPEIVQAEWRQNELVESFPEAIAIETEGEGVYSAAHDLKMEWVVIKGISGYADGTEAEEKWKTCASVTAASLVFSILNDCSIFEDWQHYRDISTDRQHSAVSKEVLVEPSCSSAQSSHQQHASSAITPGGKRRSSSESLVQGIKRSKLEDSSAMKFLEWCQNQLRAFYKTMCQVKITPWDPDNTVHINDIYIQLTLLQDHRKPDGTTKKRVGDISEVFEGDEHHPIRRRILVYGRPGIGKSTFTQQLAVDWADGRKEILRKFSLLLLIKLRDVCDIPDLCTILKTAELLSADDPMAVNNLYDYVRQNQEKVLLILDGYDEYSGGKSSPVHQIWRGGQLRDCCVMITTRPVKEDELRRPSHAQFELNGLDSREQKKQFARKILPNERDVEGLLNYLKKQNLEKMAEIPLLLLMLCLLWKEKKHRLPTSRAHIYLQFIQTLLDHMATKDADNVATGKSIDEYQEELYKIGKLAYDALLEDRLHFNFSKCAHGDLFQKLIHVGFFQVSKRSALNREKIVYFLHKSVQEFLAAWFIVEELTVKKNETVTCLSRMDTFKKSTKMAGVLKFACELSLKAAGILFDHLHDVGEKEGLTNYQFTKTPSEDDLSDEQQEFIRLCVDCLFLCPASDRTAVYSAFLSCVNHVVILQEENTSTAAVEHFFKSVSSFPNDSFFFERRPIEHFCDDVLSVMLDLNAVVLTSSGESKDVQKYADLLVGNSFLKKSGGRNFVYLIDIKDEDFHSELLPELISAPVCSSQPPVDNFIDNEKNNIDVPLPENHCLSLVREIDICVQTVEDAVLLKNVMPLVTAPREIQIWRRGMLKEAFDPLIESAINGINLTDNLHSLKFFDFFSAVKYAAFISDALQHSPNLRKLNLAIRLHSGVSHLAESLRHVPQLTRLSLWDVKMGEKECVALAASLKYLNKLEELNIRDNALGHGIIELAKNLNNVPNLTKLDLRNTNMGEDEASTLAHALKYVPLLRYLNLGCNPLGRGVRDLVQHLSSVPKLAILFLEGVQMTRTDCEELYTAVNESNISVYTDYHAELKETEVRFRDESDGDNDDDDDDESTLGKKEEELLGAKEKTMEEVSEEKESLETKGSMTEVKIRQDVEASSTMEIPQAESSTRMKSLLYAESEECNVDHQGTIWNLTEIQAGGCITFTQDAVSMPLLFGCKLLEPTVEFPPLNKDERLVSSVIELTCDEQPDIHFTGQSKGEVVVALSHSAPKLEGYEVLIGELISSDSSYEWKDLETTNIWQIPDIKDDFAKLRVPYAEAKVTTCGVFAVIYRLKSYIYSTRVSGNEEITHKIPEYPEVSVTISAENVRDRSNLELILKVQEIPQQWFDCGEEFAGPVLHIKCPQITDLAEPATITLPLLLQGDKDELSKFSATDLRVFECRSGDERADWDEITMQLPNAVGLMNGVVRFQVKHFCRFTVWPSKKHRLKDRRLAHRINRFTRPFPLEAGFFACLCNTVDMSPGHAQLRLYCYPARLEPKVIENARSAHDIDRYGNGDSLLTLFHGDELRAKLWRGSEVKKTLKLRFRYDRKFEVDAIVRVLNEGTPHVKFLQHLREQSPRKLCELTIATQCQRKARDPHHAKQEVPNSEELERLSQQVPSNE